MNDTNNENMIIHNKYNKIIINNKTTTIIKTKVYKKKNVINVKVMSTIKYIHMMNNPSEKNIYRNNKNNNIQEEKYQI